MIRRLFSDQRKLTLWSSSKLLTTQCAVYVFAMLLVSFSVKAADNEVVRKQIASFVSGSEVWNVVSYQLNEADYSNTPAQLCFERVDKKQCHIQEKKRGEFKYPFQEVTLIEALPEKIGFDGVLVISEHTGTVSGLRSIDVWKYVAQKHTFTNLVPDCVLEGKGEYRLVSQNGSGYLITAQRRWEKGESLEDPHRYHIVVYRIASSGGSVVFNSVTKNKFGGERDNISVIDAVLPEINEKIAKPGRSG